MSKNLMEAAADILSRSKAAAPGMPMEKAKGEVQDLGGVTPTDAIPHEGEGSAKTVKKATAPGKPAAVGAMPMEKAKGEVDVVKEEKDDEDEKKSKKYDDEDDDDMNEGVEQIDEATHPLGQTIAAAKKLGYNVSDRKTTTGHSTTFHHPVTKHRVHASTRNGNVNFMDHHSGISGNDDASDFHHSFKRYANQAKEDHAHYMKEDVDAILSSEQNLSEDFRSKVATIYEARVNDKVTKIQEQLEEQYAAELTEAVGQLETQLVEKIDDFLGYVVEEWMEQNEVAIETGLRSELTEDFIAGLRNLFAEHYISVPEDKVELVDELAERVEQLEGELNETVARNIEMKKQLTESKKNDIIGQVCEGLTQTQTEKIRSLVEGVEFSSEGEFQKKAETIRENYFPTTVKAASAQTLTETVEQPEGQQEITDPIMKRYAAAISKSLPK